jgi:hypothetical protein
MLSRRAVGTGVAGGMLAAALLGIFVIPALYVAFQAARERVKAMASRAAAPETEIGDHAETSSSGPEDRRVA